MVQFPQILIAENIRKKVFNYFARLVFNVKKSWKSCSKDKVWTIRLLNCVTVCCLMIEADKFNAVKDATVAIGLANKDTKDVISSFGTGFFIGENTLSARHIFLVNVLSIMLSIRKRIRVWKEYIPHLTLPQKEIS